MTDKRFRDAEDEYYRLRGQLVAGRITRAQFEDALKQMIVGDVLGRNWMLGVDDGKWYVHDGRSWVQADPYPASAPNVPFMPAPATILAPPPRQASPLQIVVLIGGIVVVCLLGITGVLVASRLGVMRITFGATATPFLLPTPMIFVMPTQPLAPMPTPFLTATARPTATATLTLTPTATLTPTLTATPTLTPRPQGNCADPSARWENVTEGQQIDPYAAFIGTANADDFSEYVVEMNTPGNILFRSKKPVVHGAIFIWNTYTVGNGDYSINLVVTLKDGTTLAPCVVRVRVAH